MARTRRSYGKLKGAAATKRLLKRLPEAVREEMVAGMTEIGRYGEALAKASAPRRTGALANAIRFLLSPRTLRLRIGILGKGLARDFFYGRILEYGRGQKRQMSDSRPRRLPGGGMTRAYARRISPIAPGAYDIVEGTVKGRVWERAREMLGPIYDRALAKVSGAAGND